MRIVLTIMVTFLLVACGVFNKSRKREKTRVKIERSAEVIEQKGVTIQQFDKDVEFTELVIRMPKDKASDLELIEEDEYKTLHEAVVEAIQNSEETTVRTSRTVESTRSEIDTGKVNQKREERIDSIKNEMDLDKQSNTTWLSNFNPWVILGVAAMIIGAVFLYFRFRK